MESNTDKPEKTLDQACAVQFIRFLWVAFNNINMYGTIHPLAKKGVENYYSFLKETQEKISPITLHVEGENLLCEKWKTSQSANVGRLVERLKSAGINSISFQADVTQDDIMETFKVIADAKNYKNIEDISKALNNQNIKSINLNTFIYKRVAVEEVEEDKDSMDREKETLSMEEREKQFEDVLKSLLGRFFDKDSDEPLSLLDQLEMLREHFVSDEESRSQLPTDELLNALMYLKSIRSDDTDTTLETGYGAKPGKEILFELELLTFELVTKFVQDKFRSGTLSPKQFGSIVRNLFTESDDLKILIPQIKEVLVSNGMSLPDYLKFVHETSMELEERGFLNLIEQIGGDIGISVKEISDDLQKNPYVPVQLIILTFKIFSLMGINGDQIISVLSQSIGLIIQNQTLEKLRNNKIEDISEIRENLSGVEDQFLQEIKSEGVDQELLLDIKKHLTQRSNILMGQVWSERVIDEVFENDELSEPDQIRKLSEKISKNKESKSLINYLLIVLEEKGHKKEFLDNLINNITESSEMSKKDKKEPGAITRPKKPVPLKLPKEISNKRETRKYLQIEINRNHRNQTSFSCISLSVTHVLRDSEIRPPTTAELAEIFLIMEKILNHTLRNIDFIGSLGSLRDNYLLVVMTMTEKIGRQKAEERLASMLPEISIKTNGSVLKPFVCISAMSFDQEKTPEIKTLVRRVKANHRKKIKLLENTSKK